MLFKKYMRREKQKREEDILQSRGEKKLRREGKRKKGKLVFFR
jgi:hypothetical protein